MNPESNRSLERTGLYKTIKQNETYSRDLLESAGQGFAFPVHEKIRGITDERVYRDQNDKEGLSKRELLKACLQALSLAWERAIKPRINEIRVKNIDHLKAGTDFFTDADTESERIIRDHFIQQFGEQSLRIFGEEANRYLGNEQSQVGVRIDPIDGTESFKFSKDADWGIMVGVYIGSAESEHQIISAVYFPERQTVLYGVEDVGVFRTNLAEGPETQIDKIGTKEYQKMPDRDDLRSIITTHWKHTDQSQRGKIDRIEKGLTKAKARVRSVDSACAEVLEALESDGKRAMIIDGDFNQVDFIPYSMLEKVGYKIYDWTGKEHQAENPELSNKKVVVVPPGKAGREILGIIKSSVGKNRRLND